MRCIEEFFLTSSEKGPYRVVIADDDGLVRLMHRLVLESDGRFSVVAEAVDAFDALKTIRSSLPDIALLDVSMPYMDDSEAAAQLRDQAARGRPHVKLVLLSALPEYVLEDQKDVFGAVGFISKDMDPASIGDRLAGLMQERG